jgi:hypothetical protein
MGTASTPTAIAWWIARLKWNFFPRIGAMKMASVDPIAKRVKLPIYDNPSIVAAPILSINAMNNPLPLREPL